MSDSNISSAVQTPVIPEPTSSIEPAREVVSTHVLVEPEKVDQLRELSRRSRVAQSEYLREAVDDLLVKYEKLTTEDR